jgi:hypothetical protein
MKIKWNKTMRNEIDTQDKSRNWLKNNKKNWGPNIID